MNSSSTYQGDALDIMIYGESHSEAIGVYINGLPEDVEKDAENTIQKAHDKFIKNLEAVYAAKDREIMSV